MPEALLCPGTHSEAQTEAERPRKAPGYLAFRTIINTVHRGLRYLNSKPRIKDPGDTPGSCPIPDFGVGGRTVPSVQLLWCPGQEVNFVSRSDLLVLVFHIQSGSPGDKAISAT